MDTTIKPMSSTNDSNASPAATLLYMVTFCLSDIASRVAPASAVLVAVLAFLRAVALRAVGAAAAVVPYIRLLTPSVPMLVSATDLLLCNVL